MCDAYNYECDTLEELLQKVYGKLIETIIGSRPIFIQAQYGQRDRYDIFTSPEQESYVVNAANKAWKHVANFSIAQLPGCCGICVFHHCEVDKEFRNKGLGDLLHKLRIDMARQMKYGMAVCTTLDTNKIEEKILKKHNWIADGMFVNPKTKNRVIHWYRKIADV